MPDNPSAYPVTSGQRSTVEEIRERQARPGDSWESPYRADIGDLLQVVDAQREELRLQREVIALMKATLTDIAALTRTKGTDWGFPKVAELASEAISVAECAAASGGE